VQPDEFLFPLCLYRDIFRFSMCRNKAVADYLVPQHTIFDVVL
jgi:hypothetical protein